MRLAVSDRVSLRAYRPEDAEELFALVRENQRHLEPWMPWAVGRLDIGQTRAFLRTSAAQNAEKSALQCAVVEDGRIAGSAGFNLIEPLHERATIGYWLAARAQGRGVMTSAVRALLEHGFAGLGLHRVQILVAPANGRSRAIPERLGFAQEGLLRASERVGDVRLDSVVYGLLAPEWARRQASP